MSCATFLGGLTSSHEDQQDALPVLVPCLRDLDLCKAIFVPAQRYAKIANCLSATHMSYSHELLF